MEVLTLNGKEYVKASKAAKDLGYTSDYVGQLCRSGAVDAHLVGRTWYVNPETLGAHRVEKKRNARVKAREQARQSIEKARSAKQAKTTKAYKNIDIRYEKDEEELIPEVRKVPIMSHQERVVKEKEEPNTKTYTLENEGKKIVLSGTLAVEDAELEEEYTDTTILQPKIIKSKQPSTHEAVVALEEAYPPQEEQHTTFQEKIAALQDENIENAPSVDTPVSMEAEAVHTPAESLRPASMVGVCILTCAVLFSLANVLLAHKTVYSSDGVATKIFLDHQSLKKYLKI